MNLAPGTMGVLAPGNRNEGGVNRAQESANKAQSRMDHYDLLEQVGKGAFGAAILVMHRTERQKYVMKKIRLARQSERAKRSAYQEMRLVSSLTHPHIVSCHDCWVEKGVYVCIVTGYCEGGDVAELLRRAQGRLFSEGRLVKWLVQILLALQYIHRHKVLHRDLKCSNLFLTRDGDIRIGDFGLARVLEENQLTTSVVGTPNYMCPELLADQPYGFKSDVWSLGCCMYELTGHRPPFKAFDMQGLIQKITKGAVPPLPAEYSPEWKAVIKSMLKKIPDQRPSVDELLEHPYLVPHVEACQRRIAETSGHVSPPNEPFPLKPATQESNTRGNNPPNGLSASAESPRLRKSAEGRIEEEGFEGLNEDPVLLRRSAESVRKNGIADGFGPEPSSSPQVVIGNRKREGIAASPSVNPPSPGVKRSAEVSSGVEEGDCGQEGVLGNGRKAGASGFVAARVQSLEALARRDSIWMGEPESPPSGIVGGSGSLESVFRGVGETAQEMQPLGGGVTVRTTTRCDTEPDSQSEAALGHVPSSVTSPKEFTDGPDGDRSRQSTEDSIRQPVQTGATKSRLALTKDSNGVRDVTATSAMTSCHVSDLDSADAARKGQPESGASARKLLKSGNTLSSKQAEFQKRVPAIGIPGAATRTGSKSSASSSASTTPSQPSPQSPLPKEKPAWVATPKSPLIPKTLLTPKTALNPKTSLTPRTSLNPKPLRSEPKPGNPGRKPLPTRPATALARNSAPVQKLTSATFPARPQTAVRSGTVTRGTIPGAAGKGLTGTAERAAGGGKVFGLGAAQKAPPRSKGGGQKGELAVQSDAEGVMEKAKPLTLIDELVRGGTVVSAKEAFQKEVSRPEQKTVRGENGTTRLGESHPKVVPAKSSRPGNLVRSIFTPRSSNTLKAGPATPGTSPKPSSTGASPKASDSCTRLSNPTELPVSSGLVSSPGTTPGSTPRGNASTLLAMLIPSTSQIGGPASKTPRRPGVDTPAGKKRPVGVKTPVQSSQPPSPLESRPASTANSPVSKTPEVTGLTPLQPSDKPFPSPRLDLSMGPTDVNRHAVNPTGQVSQAFTPEKVSSTGAGVGAEWLTPDLSPLALAKAELARRGFSPQSVGSSPEAAGRPVADTLALNTRVNALEDILARCCRLHNQQRFEELGALLTSVGQASAALGEVVGAPAGSADGELERALSQSQAGQKGLEPADFHVGDPVLVVHRNQPGVVKFTGLTHFGNGKWLGVELQVPGGKHNGTWQGVTYFTCPDKHGIFVRATSLQLRAESSPVGLGPTDDVSISVSASGDDVRSTSNVAKELTAVDITSNGSVGGGQVSLATEERNVQQTSSDVIRAAADVKGLLVGDGRTFEHSANGLERRTEEAAVAIAPLSLRNSVESPRLIRSVSPAKRRVFSPSRGESELGLVERDENKPLDWNPRSPSPMRRMAFTQLSRSPSPHKQPTGPSSPRSSFSSRLLSPPRVATSPETTRGTFSPVRRER